MTDDFAELIERSEVTVTTPNGQRHRDRAW